MATVFKFLAAKILLQRCQQATVALRRISLIQSVSGSAFFFVCGSIPYCKNKVEGVCAQYEQLRMYVAFEKVFTHLLNNFSGQFSHKLTFKNLASCI